jgi:hypothetical protein
MTNTTAQTPRGPGYNLVLPPGFVLISARGDVEADIRAKVRPLYGDTLDDRARGRLRMAERRLNEYVTEAGKRGVVDVVIPVSTFWGADLTIGIGFGPARPDAELAEGTPVETNGGEARRSVVDRPKVDELDRATAPDGSDLGHGRTVWRTVHHVWRMPETPGALLLGTFSVSGGDDPALAPLADALTELGDTIMGSLRWTGLSVAEPPAAEPPAAEQKVEQ